MSQRKAAKALGVDEKTIRNDVRNNSAKSAGKFRTGKKRRSAKKLAPVVVLTDTPCDDCTTDQERWQRSVMNMAGEAISLPAYWTQQPSLPSFTRTRSLSSRWHHQRINPERDYEPASSTQRHASVSPQQSAHAPDRRRRSSRRSPAARECDQELAGGSRLSEPNGREFPVRRRNEKIKMVSASTRPRGRSRRSIRQRRTPAAVVG
ncbi:MAG TPA: hypothetical protein VFS91_11475 [Nitrobacter sp.]|nr:hypothetical protein [Nitrobacter sp.]